jgi:HD-GYP domain-containing protein (c-di-GMP phosphodiesterase class II)
MLKKIPTHQAELGMFLQSMEGSWLSHPFWKTKFLLAEPADLESLKKSGVPFIWIDASKGKDVAAAPTPSEAPPATPQVPPVAVAPRPAAPPLAPPAPRAPGGQPALNFADELDQAAAIMQKSRRAVVGMLNEARMGRAVKQEEAAAVVEDIAGSVWRNPSALISLARLKTRDDYTYMHSVAVCAMMVALGRQLGLNEQEQRVAGEAGLLHDVGKMLMPLEVLNKPGSLTDAEFAVMKSHPERGHAALKASGVFADGVLDVCLHHHEKMDGSGYPHKLASDQLSLLARMGAVCDVYDAVTSNRPYKSAWDPAASLAKMAQWKGHFDPKVFQAFVVSLGIYPVGTLVKLQSGRLAVVVDQNPGKLTAPKVKVFFSTKSNMPIDVRVLDLATDASERIVGREDAAQWGFTHLNDLWTKA